MDFDEIIREINPIYLKDVNNINDVIRNIRGHSYDNVYFDFSKTLYAGSHCVLDKETGFYVYNYDQLMTTYVDIVSDIKSDVVCKFKYNDNIFQVNKDFKIFNFLSPYCSKSFNFYLNHENKEFKFTMRCYILSDKIKKEKFGNTLETNTHIYKNGSIEDKISDDNSDKLPNETV